MFDMITTLMRKNLTGKEVKKMNKIIVSLICTALILSMPVTSFAAFTSDSSTTKTAQVTVSGTAGVPIVLSVSLKNVATGSGTPTEITWSSVSAGALDWKSADQYVEIGGFATHAQWGIQIYTDNKATGASPLYTGTGNPAGLVNVSTTTLTLPMCWRVLLNSTIRPLTWPPVTLDTSMQEKYIATGAAAGYTVILRALSDYVSDTNFFAPWSWMLDKNTPDIDPVVTGNQVFGTNQDIANVVGSDGARVGSGDVDLSYVAIPERAAKYCVLLGAKFTAAAASVQYKTSKLTIEMYHL